MRWGGHIVRIEEKRNAYKIFVGKPQRKRPLGKQRSRLVDNIVKNLLKALLGNGR
jgi:hypothetical protein